MGNAMQLTNICRDVKEDWHRGRIYLPLEDLDRFGVSELDLADMAQGSPVTDNFRRLMGFEVERARAMYRQGEAGLGALARDGTRQTAAVMARVYAGILDAITRADGDVFSRRRHVPLLGKLARVPGALRLARGSTEYQVRSSE
jgi:phytoene synthase